MKQYLRHISIFALLTALLLLAILLLPVDKKYQYGFLISDCSYKSNLIYHRMAEDTLPLDALLLGTSHTMCGVNDSLIEDGLKRRGVSMNISSMAICLIGRNMDYAILKDVLKYKKPKLLILEVRQDEPEFGHPNFGYVADIGDIFSEPAYVNRTFASDLYNAFVVRLNYQRDRLCLTYKPTIFTPTEPRFTKRVITADTSVLYNGVRNRWERYFKHKHPAWQDNLMTRYPKYYVDAILDLANKNGVKVMFLYLPTFGYPYHAPKELAYYRQRAPLLMMPFDFYDNTSLWCDDDHLNATAAITVSDSVAAFIKKNF